MFLIHVYDYFFCMIVITVIKKKEFLTIKMNNYLNFFFASKILNYNAK